MDGDRDVKLLIAPELFNVFGTLSCLVDAEVQEGDGSDKSLSFLRGEAPTSQVWL